MNASRFGLQARFALGAAVVLGSTLLLFLLLFARQADTRRDIGALGRATVHDVATADLAERGQTSVQRLAELLANPLYYTDLDAIRTLLDSFVRQPDLKYALVFGADGLIVHDGTREIAAYGQPMRDPLAAKAVAADGLLVQWSDDVMDVSEGIYVGDQRLGGVRLGYSLDGVRAEEKRAGDTLQQRLRELARRYMVWILAIFAVLVLVSLGAIWYVQRMLVTPVRQLAEAARQIGAGRYDAASPSSTRSDEIGELQRAFARMGENIASHNRDVQRLAYTDPLTALPNRLSFRESLERSLAARRDTAQPLALLFVDLDGFKEVNDALGHDAGDAVLVEISRRIRDAVAHGGGEGALAARFGGDEFVILLQEGDVRAVAAALGSQVVEDVRRPIRLPRGRSVDLGASVGIALYPDHASDLETLLKHGDTAMYQAKIAGRNRWCFYDGVTERLQSVPS